MNYLELWYQALAAPHGYCFETTDPDRAKALLYKARREAADPELQGISIIQSPTSPDQLWLVKQRSDDGAQT